MRNEDGSPNLPSFLPLICIILLFHSLRLALRKERRLLAIWKKKAREKKKDENSPPSSRVHRVLARPNSLLQTPAVKAKYSRVSGLKNSDFKKCQGTVWWTKEGFSNHSSHKISILTMFYWQSQIYTCIVGLLIESAWMQLIKFSTNNFVTCMESAGEHERRTLRGKKLPLFSRVPSSSSLFCRSLNISGSGLKHCDCKKHRKR